MATNSLTALVNEEPLELRYPVTMVEGEPHVPITPIADMLELRWSVTDENRVLVSRVGSSHINLRVESGQTVLRTEPALRGAIVRKLQKGQELLSSGREEEGWFHVRDKWGQVGFVHESDVRIEAVEKVEPKKKTESLVQRSWIPPGQKIALVWEYTGRGTPAPSELDYLEGKANVVSPTWFRLMDEKGNIHNAADSRYVEGAHRQGYQVWGLVSNDFVPDRTHSMLTSLESRTRAIRQLLAYATQYELDGINIDFENVYLRDKDLLVQFVREFVPLAHEQGLVVSIDVTVKSQSPNWSRVYDRERLGEVVDYVAVMTYDQHGYEGSGVGSVATLPWVEYGLRGLLEEVPREKLLLGIPFYTRIWTEKKKADGSTEVSSQAVGMDRAKRFIAEKELEVEWNSRLGQHVATGSENGTAYSIWLEDQRSVELRVNLVHKYGLAGIAAWRRGLENPDVWDTIREALFGGL
jgi:spore germination protein YaaH